MSTFPVLPQYGASVIGGYVSAIIYGSTVLQLFQYFRKFREDRRAIKALVTFAFTLDTIGMGLILFTLFEGTIVHWGDPGVFTNGPEADWMTRLLSGHTFEPVLAVPIIQMFWLWRIWSLGCESSELKKAKCFRILVVALLAVMIAGEFAAMLTFAVEVTAFALRPPDLRLKILTAFALTTMAATDVCLTVAMTFLLHRARTGFRKTDLVINSLIIYVFANGLLTAAITLICLSSFLIRPTEWIWVGLFFVEERLYVSSLLASLNIRTALRAPVSYEVEGSRNLNSRQSNPQSQSLPSSARKLITFEGMTGGNAV